MGSQQRTTPSVPGKSNNNNNKNKMYKEQEIKGGPPIKFPSFPSFLAPASFETWNPPAGKSWTHAKSHTIGRDSR